MMPSRIYLLMGPPGTGKTTQAQLLSENLGSPHLNTGTLLYYASLGKGPEAQHIREKMENGEMADEELTQKLVEKYLEDHSDSAQVVIDGFPRTLKQARMIRFPIEKIFYLKVPDEVVKNRLLKRERSDDTPELIEKRLKVYHEETEPILDFYRQKGILEEINGEKSIGDVANDIHDKTKDGKE